MSDVRIIKNDFGPVGVRFRNATEQGLRALAFEGERIVKESFGTSPGGRTYRRGSVSHTASLPNYPPNVDTGNLRASIRVRPINAQKFEIVAATEYAAYLEYGTSKMKARPFMGPMLQRVSTEAVYGPIFKREMPK